LALAPFSSGEPGMTLSTTKVETSRPLLSWQTTTLEVHREFLKVVFVFELHDG